jgi:pyruvate/2-oxoglutarate dehydrogenase complex dihydrolipoamide dehydrogenase (E3) component
MRTFDAIIVGAGQAGPSLAARLTKAGQRVAFVERKLFGGTCVNTGCTPTKAMVASAYAAHMARRAAEYGVVLGAAGLGVEVSVDMKAVIARRESIVGRSRNGVEASLRGNPLCTVFVGTAKFESPTTMRVGDEVLEAKQIFLNVGARASVPELPGVRDVPYLTNTSLLALETLPKHLVVVGGSYIGIEFGQMYRRFGSEVTIVEKGPRLMGHEDEDVSAAVLEILEGEGIRVRLNSECIHFAKTADGLSVGTQCDVGEPASVGSHVLLAVGRTPNTQDLGLERAGVKTDEHGYIVVDDQLRTSVEGIYAMGDCNGRGAFTHTAYNDFEIVAANLLDNDPRRVSDRIPCYAMYMDPPLARIGMTEREVRATGRPALMGTRPMTRVNRALEKGESLGFMKVLVDAESKKILGASLLGVGCDEAIHCLLDVMYAGAPYTTVQRAVHIHPTVSELLPTLLGDLKKLD